MVQGSLVAIVTPFDPETEEIDRTAFRQLVKWHTEEGTDGIVVAGTTGEAPALKKKERRELIEMAGDVMGSDMELIAGTGSSSTRETVELTSMAEASGATAALVVAPFYNKPEPEGLIDHYTAVSGQTDIPIILYDNPSRSGIGIPPRVVSELSARSSIVAIKEASGDLTHAMQIRKNSDLHLLSGSDPYIYPIMALGGTGSINVIANVAPGRTRDMIHYALEGNVEKSREVYEELFPLMHLLGRETNPIPVKYALSLTDRIAFSIRSPLTRPTRETRDRIQSEMADLGLV